MAVSVLEINTDMLFSDADSIQGEIRSLAGAADDLRRAAESLNGMWEGEARDTFMKAFQRELSGLEDAVKTLECFTLYTEACGEEYEQCERAVTDVVHGIRI